jgi:CBS domain-containing protein
MKNFVLLYVKDVMTSDVVKITPDTKLKEVEKLFEKHDYNSLPVLDGDKIVGIVTKLDFLRHFVLTPKSIVPPYKQLLEDRAKDIMNKTMITLSAETPLTRVLELMVETKLRSFLVTDPEMKLLGIISREDIISEMK